MLKLLAVCGLVWSTFNVVQAVEPPTVEPLTITLPQEYQVFQREKADQGKIRIEGKTTQAKTVTARLDQGEWQPLTIQDDGQTFAVDLLAPVGGWYVVEIRLCKGEKTVAEKKIEHVGVGEIFIVAGQSNSANYGSEKQKPASGKVVNFDGTRWSIANDPQPGATGNGGSFLPAFGDALVEKIHVPVAVVPCGIGATSVRQWLPKGERMTISPTTGAFVKQVERGVWECNGQPFDTLLNRVNHFGPHGVRAILWHQGESDCGQATEHEITGEQYRQFAEVMIRESRKQAGWDIPWLVAQVSYHGGKTPLYDGIRAAQQSLWKDGLAHEGPDTDGLKQDYRSGVHFNTKGLQAHGQLWAEKIMGQLER